VWTIRPPEPWEKKFGKHPAQKPVALVERIILASSNEDDLLLDPFAGSGTTLLAAAHSTRRAIGIEIDPKYVETAKKRLGSNHETGSARSQETSSTPLLFE